MNAKWWFVSLVLLIMGSCDSHVNQPEYLSIKHNTKGVNSVEIIKGKWFALGDSDFDSYQADDLPRRVNTNASNANCVLSPIDVQVKDGKDFGEFAKWEDGRRHDYRNNFALSGASVQSSLFGWRNYFEENVVSGMIALIRELRNSLLGKEHRLGKAIISELKNFNLHPSSTDKSAVVQISIGINDINEYDNSMYQKFTSKNSHFSWIDRRTGALKQLVNEMLEAHSDVVIVLWQLLDDSVLGDQYSSEQEIRIIAHTDHWNSNLQTIADMHSNVIVFKANTFMQQLIGRDSNETNKDIVIDGIKYIRKYVPNSSGEDKVDNTKYIMTRDGHGNTILSTLFTREMYRMLNDQFGAGIPIFSPVEINTITCQINNSTSEDPVLKIPADAIIKHTELPYSLGNIVAYDSNGKDISDSAVAVSDIGGVLFGDGQHIQMRASRHEIGMHRVTVTVRDANGLTKTKNMSVKIEE